MVGNGGVLRIGQVLNAEKLLSLLDAGGGEGGDPILFVYDVVTVQIVLCFLVVSVGKDHFLHPGHQTVGLCVELRGCLALTGDNQGGTGFINEDGVYLIHDGKGVAPLNHFVLVGCHVVTEVVKAHLVVGTVGDICGIGFLPLLIVEAVIRRMAEKDALCFWGGRSMFTEPEEVEWDESQG